MTESFEALRLAEPILRALTESGYDKPTPIQTQAIPPLLEGRDLFGIAQTGTGKTAAFALPLLDLLDSSPRARPRRPIALVLTPTRELAAQIDDSFRRYSKYLNVRHAVVFGGVKQGPQTKALRRGVDVLVATPGRLEDLMQQQEVDLSAIDAVVLDEADRMLDMGFAPAVRRILTKVPDQRQTVLFSATLPEAIRELSGAILRDPVRVEITPQATTVEKIEQSVRQMARQDKVAMLCDLLSDPSIGRTLVFSRTKHGADRLARKLHKAGEKVDAIHGDKGQGARKRALTGFRSGKLRVLVATDVAARGIDVPDVTHVVNFDVPNEPDAYVHRIGRTARAGRTGVAITFCAPEERDWLAAIETEIRAQVPVDKDHEYHVEFPERSASKSKGGKAKSRKARANKGKGAGKGRAAAKAGAPRREAAEPRVAEREFAADASPMVLPGADVASGPWQGKDSAESQPQQAPAQGSGVHDSRRQASPARPERQRRGDRFDRPDSRDPDRRDQGRRDPQDRRGQQGGGPRRFECERGERSDLEGGRRDRPDFRGPGRRDDRRSAHARDGFTPKSEPTRFRGREMRGEGRDESARGGFRGSGFRGDRSHDGGFRDAGFRGDRFRDDRPSDDRRGGNPFRGGGFRQDRFQDDRQGGQDERGRGFRGGRDDRSFDGPPRRRKSFGGGHDGAPHNPDGRRNQDTHPGQRPSRPDRSKPTSQGSRDGKPGKRPFGGGGGRGPSKPKGGFGKSGGPGRRGGRPGGRRPGRAPG